jgi:O-6-methylguanine DNA methyltransferase
MPSGVLTTPLGPLFWECNALGFQRLFFDDTSPSVEQNPPVFDNDDQVFWIEALNHFLDGRAPWPKLPYALPHATSLQHQVWRALTAIPAGQVRTYGDVAAMIGYGHAVRAVAQACAANPCAIIIPCHRVVPRAGGIGSYRWGERQKQALLIREGVNT